MNSIKAVQEEPCQLDRLAAKTRLYGIAKQIFAAQIIFNVLVSVATALWAINNPDQPQVRSWAAIWGIGFTFADLFWLTPSLKARKKTAATIQEMFDCDVLQLPWKRGRSTVDVEDVTLPARQLKQRIGQAKFDEKFLDWYRGDFEALPLELARLICQRSNFRWDMDLRRIYTNVLTGFLTIIISGLLIYAFARNLPALQWLTAALLPLQPLIVFCARQIQENHEAVAAIKRLKTDTEKIWDEALESARGGNLDAEALTTKARDIQDEAWEQRIKKPLIFDRVYKLQKNKGTETMDIAAAAFIAQAEKALNQAP